MIVHQAQQGRITARSSDSEPTPPIARSPNTKADFYDRVKG